MTFPGEVLRFCGALYKVQDMKHMFHSDEFFPSLLILTLPIIPTLVV